LQLTLLLAPIEQRHNTATVLTFNYGNRVVADESNHD